MGRRSAWRRSQRARGGARSRSSRSAGSRMAAVLRACLEAGASGVAVMGVIMRAADPTATMIQLISDDWNLVHSSVGVSARARHPVAGVSIAVRHRCWPLHARLRCRYSRAEQLAEIGVILLIFGIGLHFSIGDLLTVYAICWACVIGLVLARRGSHCCPSECLKRGREGAGGGARPASPAVAGPAYAALGPAAAVRKEDLCPRP